MSWLAPAETLETNILGQCNLLEAVRKVGKGYNPVILIAGSSEEYGLVKSSEVPIKETNPLRPMSPYAISKIAQDFMGYQYYKSYGMKIIRARAFNHSGARRGEVFVDSNFAKQIAEIEAGLNKPIIKVGNLNAIRDFTDVRDIVRAYWLASEKCEYGEVYNICSNKGIKVSDVLRMLLKLSGLKKVRIVKDPTRQRPSDVPILIGDCKKFRKATGWKPEINYRDTLLSMLSFWRKKSLLINNKG